MVAIDAPESVAIEQVRVNATTEYVKFCGPANIQRDLRDVGHENCRSTDFDIKVKAIGKEKLFETALALINEVIDVHAEPSQPEAYRVPELNLVRMVNRARSSTRPEDPRDLTFTLDEKFLSSAISEPFFRMDVIVGRKRHLIFATNKQLQLLGMAKTWYIDGTFKVIKKPFYQLLSIHGFVRSGDDLKQIPLCFCIMSGKKKRHYKKVKDKFHQLREMAEREREDHVFPKLPLCDQSSECVCLNDRDSAVTSLRCLQMFYRFGADTFATAVHLLDRFLSRIKVKRKYLSCVTAATYFLSAKFHEDSEETPTATELSHLHQFVWKPSDLKRMELIVLEKLGWELWSRTTPLSFLRIIYSILQLLDIPGLVRGFFETIAKLLEICLNHTICAHFRPCTLAVCALQYYIKHYGPTSIMINFLLLDIQNICQIADSEMLDCYCAVSKQLLEYDSQVLSSPPSLPVPKPISRSGLRSRLSFYENSLPTIEEVGD